MVSSSEGAAFAKQNGLLYIETSAKEGWGVVDAFERSAREVLRRLNESELRKRKVRATLEPNTHNHSRLE